MDQRTLHIENFGPVSDATVELRAVNLFIGEQSIGKSTLAKLIAIFSDHITLCKLIQGGIGMWEEQLKDYNLDIYMEDCYRISYELRLNESFFHLEYQPGDISYYLISGENKLTDPKEISKWLLQKSGFTSHKESILELSKNPDTELLSTLISHSLYIPAERIIYSVLTNLLPALALAKSTIPQNLLRFLVELGNAKSEYPRFRINLLNIAFRHESTEDSIVLNANDKSIPLAAASSGIQSLVPLLLVLHYAINKGEYYSYVIEEPECNLFPTKQVELFYEILKMVKSPARTLTIATHSPYLLAAINNLLFAGMVAEEFGKEVEPYISESLPKEYWLGSHECSVYSLGKEINGGEYCRSLIDPETGMVDFNSLDEVSEDLSIEFETLQRIAADFSRKG